jgi:hypothetical protein
MSRTILLLLISLATILTVSPAAWASEAPAPELPELVAPADEVPALSVDVGLGATVEWASNSCQISRDCGDGNTVQCSGNASCSVSQKGVTCDGQEVACPNFCQISLNCTECRRISTCWSTAGDCMFTTFGISCRGIERTCDMVCRFF